MSQSSSYAHKLAKVIAENGAAYTFTKGGNYNIYKISDSDVIPLWDSEHGCEIVVENHSKYAEFEISKVSGPQLDKLFETLREENIKIGANWYGKRLTGYNYNVDEFLEIVNYYKLKAIKNE